MDGQVIEQRCRQPFSFRMQGTANGLMVLGSMEVLAAATGRVVLLVLMGIAWPSFLVLLLQQVAIIVRTASL